LEIWHLSSTAQPRPKNALAWQNLAPRLFVLLWASGFVVGKLGLPYARPFTILLLRFAIATLFMVAVSLLTRANWPKTRIQAFHVAVVGVLLQVVYLGGCYVAMADGIPAGVRALFAELPFNDVAGTRDMIRQRGRQLAAVVVEPVVVAEPTRAWLDVLKAETQQLGAVLIFDEIKTAFRLAVGGAGERYGVRPDLAVLGKALANGFPLALVGGRADLMAGATRTWMSSTLATEGVALAAARATLDAFEREAVCDHLHRVGTRLLHGLHRLQRKHPDTVAGVAGMAEMCFLHYATEDLSRVVAVGCAKRGLLFKRTAYNFVSLAHDEGAVDRALDILDEVLGAAGG